MRMRPLRFPLGLRRGGVGQGRGKFRLWPLLIFALVFIYYQVSYTKTVPMTGRAQLVDISMETERALGLSSYRAVLSKEDVVPSGEQVERIRSIGQRIAGVTDANGYNWEFNLINSKQVNAFALPGGKVAVYTGILPVTKNDDGLAAVMGHEIAHAIARHGAERMTQQKLAQMGSLAVGVSVGEMDVQTRQIVMAAFGLGAQYGVLRPFSRKHESEADYMGLMYLARACFDPTEAPKLWERMAQVSQGKNPPEFLSTHPAPATRIRQFNEWMPEALKVRSEHCG